MGHCHREAHTLPLSESVFNVLPTQWSCPPVVDAFIAVRSRPALYFVGGRLHIAVSVCSASLGLRRSRMSTQLHGRTCHPAGEALSLIFHQAFLSFFKLIQEQLLWILAKVSRVWARAFGPPLTPKPHAYPVLTSCEA